jgi:hypothetical protein
MLAGCSGATSRAGSQTIPLGPLTSGAAPAQNTKQVCTRADLEGPALTMPPAQNISSSVFFRSGIVANLDPTPGANPRLAATDAWATFTHASAFHARQAELLLGTFSAWLPYGLKGPHHVQVLAWVLHLHHLAYPLPAGDAATGTSGASSHGKAVCEFVDAVLVVDAMTGAVVIYSY